MSSLMDEEAVKAKIEEIKSSITLPEAPSISSFSYQMDHMNVIDYIGKVQEYIESFAYNYTGRPFIRMNRSRGTGHIQNVCKKLMKEALPIQCVEAVFLGTYLTAGMSDLVRIPISFKTKFIHGSIHRHIVLAIRYQGKWGAVGISRRNNLMNKDITFSSLSELVQEYKKSYEQCLHKLITIYLGLPLPHDKFTDQPIKWKATKISIAENSDSSIEQKVNQFTGNMTKLAEYFAREGQLPTTIRKAKI